MTDANLMDADCIHGNTWWECPTCEEMTEFFNPLTDQKETDESTIDN